MFRQRVNKWINRRIPPSDTIALAHNNLFILPSRFGVSLLFCIILLFLLGTNYQNNPVLLLSYLMVAWMLVAMILCFMNLNGCQITIHSAHPVHRGQHMELPLIVKCQGRKFNWRFLENDTLLAQWSIIQNSERNLVYLYMDQRGLQSLPRLRLETRFPFGLFVCWTYLRFEQRVWVFPKVEGGEWHLVSRAKDVESENQTKGQSSNQQITSESLNFEGIREYQVGESLSRISWKHQARNPDAPLLLKDFSSPEQTADWLTFDSLGPEAGRSTELDQKLDRLTFALLQLDSQKRRFGLSLTGFVDAPLAVDIGKGEEHLLTCLKGLANFGLSESNRHD